MRTDADERRNFLGVEFDTLSMEDLLRRLERVTADAAYSYVVTPNVDHLVRLLSHAEHREDAGEIRLAYDRASLCICDSRVLARTAKLCGIVLPVVTGSDLTARLFQDVIRAGDTVMLVGGDTALLDAMRVLHPQLDLRQHLPPMGLRDDEAAMDDAVEHVVRSGARFIFLAVGSPQQEILAHRIASRADARGCAFCIGAAVEFVVGHQKRAPRWVQGLGIEWGYRLARDPGRLWHRYLVDGPKIFLLAWRWQRARPSKR